MAIAYVVDTGDRYVLKDARGSQIKIIPHSSDCKLLGWTASTVTFERDKYVFVYNEKGQLLSRRQY